MATTYNDDVRFNGQATFAGNLSFGETAKDKLLEGCRRDNQPYNVILTDLRTWDAFATNLPGTAASDDLALIGGTFGSAAPKISAGDLKNAGSTSRKARFIVKIPPEYVAGETATLRFYAGMETTVASSAATLDVEAYRQNGEGVVSGSDLYTGAAQSINSLTFSNKDFSLTSTNLTPGEWIDVVITILVNDSATVTAVDAAIGVITFLCDCEA